jgi:hypothetical protein
MFVASMTRAVSLGAKYGLRAIPMYTDKTVETPEIGTEAMEGAVGIVVTLAAVNFGKYENIFPGAESSRCTSQQLSSVACQRPQPVWHFPQRGTPRSPHLTRTQPHRSVLPVSCR